MNFDYSEKVLDLMSKLVQVTTTVNGENVSRAVEPRTNLVDFVTVSYTHLTLPTNREV